MYQEFGYNEFSIENAITPSYVRQSVKLNGMNRVWAIMSNNDRSSEAYIAGAINDMGVAERSILYVNSSLNNLSQRLRKCSKIANSINTCIDRGVEGFQNAEKMNPWEYAVEGKVGDFFKKIWEAIKTACRRIIAMISNFIKYIGNAIANLDVKAQVRDYNYYKTNSAIINKYYKNVAKNKFNSLDWDVNANDIAKLIKSSQAAFLKTIKEKSEDKQMLENFSRQDLSNIHTPADMANVYSIFGITGLFNGVSRIKDKMTGGSGSYYAAAAKKIQSVIDNIDRDLDGAINTTFGQKKKAGAKSPAELVMGYCTKTGTVKQISVDEMKKISGDFAVLADSWLSNNVKIALASAHAAQVEFTQYTKIIDKVAAKFDKITEAKKNGTGQLSQLTSKLANARVRYNLFFSRLMLELESIALRFRKSSHIALKMVIRSAKAGPVAKKGKESLSVTDVDDLFRFN